VWQDFCGVKVGEILMLRVEDSMLNNIDSSALHLFKNNREKKVTKSKCLFYNKSVYIALVILGEKIYN
jgi:hypothetical protein